LTYRLPAPPTTSRRVSVPLRISHRCFSVVLCWPSVSGVQAPNASTTASKPFKSAAVRSNRSFVITLLAADRFAPRTTAVTSRPRSTASLTIRRPAFPLAQITAIFMLRTSIDFQFCFERRGFSLRCLYHSRPLGRCEVRTILWYSYFKVTNKKVTT